MSSWKRQIRKCLNNLSSLPYSSDWTLSQAKKLTSRLHFCFHIYLITSMEHSPSWILLVTQLIRKFSASCRPWGSMCSKYWPLHLTLFQSLYMHHTFLRFTLTLSFSLWQYPNKHSLSGYVTKILYNKKILIDQPVNNASWIRLCMALACLSWTSGRRRIRTAICQWVWELENLSVRATALDTRSCWRYGLCAQWSCM